MGKLAEYGKRLLNWQNEQSEINNINADIKKKKKIIAETKKKIAAKMAPGNVVMKGRRGMQQAGATESEMAQMGFDKDE